MNHGWLANLFVLVAFAVSSIAPAGEHYVAVDRPLLHVSSPLYEAWIDCEYHCLSRLSCIVTAKNVAATDDLQRNWFTSPEAEPFALESSDYTGSGMDKGHTRALRWCHQHPAHDDCNFMPVIVPQYPEVNRGPIKGLEAYVCELAVQHGFVDVEIRCQFDDPRLTLNTANEPCRVPSGFNYILQYPEQKSIRSMLREEYVIPNTRDVDSDFRVHSTAAKE